MRWSRCDARCDGAPWWQVAGAVFAAWSVGGRREPIEEGSQNGGEQGGDTVHVKHTPGS